MKALIHRCHAEGCHVEVEPKLLMCLRHWRMVPRELQNRVWKHYRPGQEIDKNPTPEYLEVMKEAIAAVAIAPFGWEVEVLCCDKMLKLEQNSERKSFYFVGSRRNAERRAMLKQHVWRIVGARPFCEADWRRAFGNPEERGL